MSELAYKRILLKFSGEALAGEKHFGIDPEIINKIGVEVHSVKKLGVEIGIVIGGGNIFRGMSASKRGMNRVTADYMGMLATVINALAFRDTLERIGLRTHVMSAIRIEKVTEEVVISKAIGYLESGEIVIFCGGTGNPFFSTDSAAALRAAEIEADAIVKATKVDGVYDKDPERYPDAQFFKELDYQTIIENQLKVMDLTAVTFCQENSLPILVCNMKKEGYLKRLLMGEKIGTIVSGRRDD